MFIQADMHECVCMYIGKHANIYIHIFIYLYAYICICMHAAHMYICL